MKKQQQVQLFGFGMGLVSMGIGLLLARFIDPALAVLFAIVTIISGMCVLVWNINQKTDLLSK